MDLMSNTNASGVRTIKFGLNLAQVEIWALILYQTWTYNRSCANLWPSLGQSQDDF